MLRQQLPSRNYNFYSSLSWNIQALNAPFSFFSSLNLNACKDFFEMWDNYASRKKQYLEQIFNFTFGI